MGDKVNKAREKVVSGLDLPKDVILGVPKIIIIGRDELTIENHKGIVKFESQEIAINTSIGILNVRGEGLEIILVGGTTISLKGKIKEVVYEEHDEE